jgi:putative peptide zinc metalloprotease protein
MTALAPLRSDVWYRVAGLRPKLRPHARLFRHRYRGQVWYVIQDPATGRAHRFTPSARIVIALMDGRHSVAELWEFANKRLGEEAPTQDELVQLLGQLHASDLLMSDAAPDVAELLARGEREQRARYRRSFGNPMALRIQLWDPDAFLNRVQGLMRRIWSVWGALAWLAVVIPAPLLVFAHWPELSNDFTDQVLSVNNLLALYLVFPVVKLLHELGHATAAKAGGGEVHDLGIMFMVLLPIPYIEASSATTFKSKYRRAMVGAAGVATELFVAAIAFYLWLLVEPGIVRAVLFNVMAIAGVSTVIFNGNPLLRYDAYYVLADLIEVPNLASRSLRYFGYLFERYALGVREATFFAASRTEKIWFVCYGFASTLYRIIVTVFIALFIAERFFIVGALLAIWAVAVMAIVPVFKAARYLATNPRLRRHRVRAVAVPAGIIVAICLFVLVLPVTNYTPAEGVVWLADQALVRAGVNGFLTDFVAEPGTTVAKGDALIKSDDPALTAQLKISQARVAELEAAYVADAAADRAKAQIAREKLGQEQENLALTQQRASELIVHARPDGIFIVPQHADTHGRYYRRGDLLGYVIGEETPLVRVIVQQDAVDMVRQGTDRVRIRLSDRPEAVFLGRIVREVPLVMSICRAAHLPPRGAARLLLISAIPRVPRPCSASSNSTLRLMRRFTSVNLGSAPLSDLNMRRSRSRRSGIAVYACSFFHDSVFEFQAPVARRDNTCDRHSPSQFDPSKFPRACRGAPLC